MNFGKAKEVASEMLNVGKNRVWINPKEKDRVAEAMTKQDVRALVDEGIIAKKKKSFQSRSRARALAKKKKKGRKKGRGKRRGTKKARTDNKKRWIRNVRAQRIQLRDLKKNKKIAVGLSYAKIYRMVKGGYFRGKKYISVFAEGREKR